MSEAISETLKADRGRYTLDIDGAHAELTYQIKGALMVIDHTFTPPALRGRGVAGRLVERAVADARARHWTIAPLCPYVKAKMERSPDMHDLIDAGVVGQATVFLDTQPHDLVGVLSVERAAPGEAADPDDQDPQHREAGDRGDDEQRVLGHGLRPLRLASRPNRILWGCKRRLRGQRRSSTRSRTTVGRSRRMASASRVGVVTA